MNENILGWFFAVPMKINDDTCVSNFYRGDNDYVVNGNFSGLAAPAALGDENIISSQLFIVIIAVSAKSSSSLPEIICKI